MCSSRCKLVCGVWKIIVTRDRFADADKQQIPPLRCAPVGMTLVGLRLGYILV
jgi:hypothetical protein